MYIFSLSIRKILVLHSIFLIPSLAFSEQPVAAICSTDETLQIVECHYHDQIAVMSFSATSTAAGVLLEVSDPKRETGLPVQCEQLLIDGNSWKEGRLTVSFDRHLDAIYVGLKFDCIDTDNTPAVFSRFQYRLNDHSDLMQISRLARTVLETKPIIEFYDANTAAGDWFVRGDVRKYWRFNSNASLVGPFIDGRTPLVLSFSEHSTPDCNDESSFNPEPLMPARIGSSFYSSSRGIIISVDADGVDENLRLFLSEGIEPNSMLCFPFSLGSIIVQTK